MFFNTGEKGAVFSISARRDLNSSSSFINVSSEIVSSLASSTGLISVITFFCMSALPCSEAESKVLTRINKAVPPIKTPCKFIPMARRSGSMDRTAMPTAPMADCLRRMRKRGFSTSERSFFPKPKRAAMGSFCICSARSAAPYIAIFRKKAPAAVMIPARRIKGKVPGANIEIRRAPAALYPNNPSNLGSTTCIRM